MLKKWQNIKRFLVGIFVLQLVACGEKTIDLSVYHWETEFDLNIEEEVFLTDGGIHKIYAKFFDITLDQNQQAMPVAKIDFRSDPMQEIVPVVYIITDVFKALDSSAIKELAKNTYNQLYELHPKKSFSEVQIDCDWMTSIKDKYFYFLSELKDCIGEAEISCTLRLYQYKYPNLAGVPPVDKCALMYYNMGELTSYEESNSILNNAIGEAYLGFGDYPLPLDFALPNFSWTLLYRYGEFQQIIPSVSETNLGDTSLFEFQENNYYSVKKDTFFQNVYFRFGDELRHETCAEADLLHAAKLLSPEKNQTHTTLLFYDLKPKIANESDKINHVFTAFRQ